VGVGRAGGGATRPLFCPGPELIDNERSVTWQK
jgi:hypothetical protein